MMTMESVIVIYTYSFMVDINPRPSVSISINIFEDLDLAKKTLSYIQIAICWYTIINKTLSSVIKCVICW